MKKIIFAAALLIASFNSYAQKTTYVDGYIRSNGTYVQGYMKTSPNNTRNDNYSTIGNTNPYTGSNGTKPRDNYYPSTYSTTTNYNSRTYTPRYKY